MEVALVKHYTTLNCVLLTSFTPEQVDKYYHLVFRDVLFVPETSRDHWALAWYYKIKQDERLMIYHLETGHQMKDGRCTGILARHYALKGDKVTPERLLIESNEWDHNCSLLQFYLQERRVDEALAQFQKSQSTPCPLCHHFMGSYYQRQGDDTKMFNF